MCRFFLIIALCVQQYKSAFKQWPKRQCHHISGVPFSKSLYSADCKRLYWCGWRFIAANDNDTPLSHRHWRPLSLSSTHSNWSRAIWGIGVFFLSIPPSLLLSTHARAPVAATVVVVVATHKPLLLACIHANTHRVWHQSNSWVASVVVSPFLVSLLKGTVSEFWWLVFY